MDLFKSPTWDVDNESKTLNRELFGSGKKSKVNLNINQTTTSTGSKNKSSRHLKSSSSENVISKREAFVSKVKGKFSKKKIVKEDGVKDSLTMSNEKPVKKRKKKRANQATNGSFAYKIADETELTTASPKTKKSRDKLNILPSLIGLPNLKSKRKRKFVLPENGVTGEVENYRPLKSSKLPSTSSLSNNDESVVIGGGKRKRNKRNRNTEESLTNTSAQSTQNNDNEIVENDIVDSSNQSKKMKPNKLKKQKSNSMNVQPQSTSRINIDQKNSKALSRRQPGTLRERMMRKLQVSRFRYLNEQMYCSKGEEAFQYFKSDPQAFEAYHHGYRQQVAKWPMNPLTTIISSLKKNKWYQKRPE